MKDWLKTVSRSKQVYFSSVLKASASFVLFFLWALLNKNSTHIKIDKAKESIYLKNRTKSEGDTGEASGLQKQEYLTKENQRILFFFEVRDH